MVSFKHKYIKNTSLILADAAIAAAGKMLETLCNHMPTDMTKTTTQSGKQLGDILQEAAGANKFANIKLTSYPPLAPKVQQKLSPTRVPQTANSSTADKNAGPLKVEDILLEKEEQERLFCACLTVAVAASPDVNPPTALASITQEEAQPMPTRPQRPIP